MAVGDQHGIEPRAGQCVRKVGQMLRFANACVNQRGRSVVASDQISVVARSGHRTGVMGGQQDWSHLETIAKRRLNVRVPAVLAEEIVALAGDADGGERRAPMLTSRLRVLELAVQAVAVLTDGGFEPKAAKWIDCVRRAR